MTRLPHESWEVRGVEGPKYKVGPNCAVPGCLRFADHAHHIWRRSFLAGDYRWVKLWNGDTLQNLTGLCFQHHELVTINEATLVYEDGMDYPFRWTSSDTFGPLEPQPLTLDAFSEPAQLTVDGGEVPHSVVVREAAAPEACPTCGKRKKLKEELPPGPKRNRASWAVSVPKDERESGADVLDTLELECAKLLGREDHSSHKYFTLAEVMAFFLQSYGVEA